MPRRFGPERLHDILDAAADIQELIDGRTGDDYRADRLLRRAVERCLEVISEASRTIPETMKARYPGLPWRGIADFGNVLRHAYDHVDDSRVWAVAAHELPALVAAVETMLREIEDRHPPGQA
jgi:uncharacterized protein with HEPN domain